MNIQDARYFEVTMQPREGEIYKTHVWAFSEFGVREAMDATEPGDRILAWRIVDCPCDGEARCSFHAPPSSGVLSNSDADYRDRD